MRKPKIYLDTLQLWEVFKQGEYDIFISDITFAELMECKEEKQILLAEFIDEIEYTELQRNDEVKQLANEYISEGILTQKSYDDCLHLAIASIASCDIILSWNFKHMVRYKTIEGVRRINAYKGYFNFIDIIQPSILLDGSDF